MEMAVEELAQVTRDLQVPGESLTPVADFYRDRSVLITGGTGFIGKVLIEKFLRCTDVKYVFVLLRPKNGKETNERIKEITDCQIFKSFKSQDSSVLDKIIAVGGDICKPDMGLARDDKERLIREVSLVFHSAAEVRFIEPLRVAIENNVVGTKRVLKFCQELERIEAFVHVSTAYANCHLKEIEEKIYTPYAAYGNILEALSWMSDQALDAVTPHILEGRPNTYTFSKALAENVLMKEGGNIPICIVRPSIVIGSLQEPLPGWVEGANGPTGLTAVLSKGVLRTACVDLRKKLDTVPVDLVINLLLTAGWKTAITKPEKPMVYNLTSGTLNPFTLDMIQTYVLRYIYENPCKELYRYPGCRLTKSRAVYKFHMLVDHYIPGFIADLVAPCIGYKPGMMKLYKKITRELEMMSYFYTNEWAFHGENVLDLASELTLKEKKVFNFDITSFTWEEGAKSFVLGIREFILKEDASTLSTGKVVLKRWYIIQKVVDLLAFGAVVKIGLIYSDSITEMFNAILEWF